MTFRFPRIFRKFARRGGGGEIAPDEIFLDATNLPRFDTSQFEGRIVKPISRRSLIALGASIGAIALILSGKLWGLQVAEGEVYAALSEENRLAHSIVFTERGVIFDRTGREIAWNIPGGEFPLRAYADLPGLAHLVGYVSYPRKDASGVYYSERTLGRAGAEAVFESSLGGENGLKIVETDVRGSVRSESVIRPPRKGESVTLSIDARLTEALQRSIADLARRAGFTGGAGVILDVDSGEVLALTSYPEFDQEALSRGSPEGTIRSLIESERAPFLNRAVGGLYTPGSIVKPIIAAAALAEGVATRETTIVSTGSISIPNPFAPGAVSVFNDWRAHGAVDLPRAIAVSSNVYFFEIGGGYRDRKGLGIERIERYARLFGLGSPTGVPLPGEAVGTIPSPAWKAANFADGVWRIGDTYNTAIGQYGFQVTPIQMARAVAAIASGRLVTPTIRAGERGKSDNLPLAPENLAVVREGMRLAVTAGTAGALNGPVSVAAKTGTAELGAAKRFVNSWVVGFFPYEGPRYAFAVIMERGPRENLVGAASVMRELLAWMERETPAYLAPRGGN